MWIFKNDAFVSLVQDRDMPDVLWVRARVQGHLEAFLGELMPTDVPVIETPEADYRFRIAVSKGTASCAALEAVEGIDYPNFKNSVAGGAKGNRFHDALLGVWHTMVALQRKEVALLAGKKRRGAAKRAKGKGAEVSPDSPVTSEGFPYA